MVSNLTLIAAAAASLAAGARAAPACEGAPSAARLRIVVEGLRSDKGLVAATLYPDDPATFLKAGGALKVWRTAALSPSTALCIWLPAPGAYAVAVYHDANANLKWDHARLGQIEGFGFSNNPRIFFSAPTLAATRFRAAAGETTLRIQIHYR